MSIVDYSIINKLYKKDAQSCMHDIVKHYEVYHTAIINYLYGAIIVKNKLLDQEKPSSQYDVKSIMLDSDFLLPDGAALRVMRLVGSLLNRRSWPRMLANLNGTDFMPSFLDYLHNETDYIVNLITLTVFDPRINNPKWYLMKGALDYIAKRRPKFAVHGEEILYGDSDYDQFDRSWVETFLGSSARGKKPEARSINLFLNFRWGSYGARHQEIFAYVNKDKLKELELLCMNQAATVDFWIGRESRAPKRIRVLRLESLYRLFSDPKKNRQKFLISFQTIGLIISKLIFKPKLS